MKPSGRSIISTLLSWMPWQIHPHSMLAPPQHEGLSTLKWNKNRPLWGQNRSETRLHNNCPNTVLVLFSCHATIYGRKSTAMCTKHPPILTKKKNSTLPMYGQRPNASSYQWSNCNKWITKQLCAQQKRNILESHLCHGLVWGTRSLTIRTNQRPN